MKHTEQLQQRVTHVLWLSERPGHPAFGGAENHLWVLLPALVAAGVHVELLALVWGTGPTIRDRLSALRDAGVKVSVLELDSRRRWWALGRKTIEHTVRLVHAFRQRDSLLHLHLDFQVAPWAALISRRPLVMSLHADLPAHSREQGRGRLVAMLNRADALIAISDHVARFYLQSVGVRREIDRVYYGVPTPTRLLTRQAARQQLGLPADPLIVGFVARLEILKNLQLLIAAAEHLPEWHVVVVGDGVDRDELVTLGRRKLGQRFHYCGYQTNAADLMPAFDLLCLPSKFEGLGLVLIEGMLRNVPVAASRIGAVVEVLDDGRAGALFSPYSEQELAAILNRFAANRSSFDPFVSQAYTHATNRFSVDQMVRGTLDVYRAVLEQRS